MSPPDPAEEFVFLLARHERLIGAYVMTMVPHPQDADDILEEAKVVMWLLAADDRITDRTIVRQIGR